MGFNFPFAFAAQPIAGGLTLPGAVTINGDVTLGAGADLIMGALGQILADDNADETLPAYSFRGDINTGWYRGAADQTRRVVGGGIADIVTSSGYFIYIPIFAESYISLNEMAAPAAQANHSVVYSVDVATKTQLTAKQGAAGTTIALAIEV